VPEPERRQIARADDDIGPKLVDLGDRALQEADLEVRAAAVEIGDLSDPKHVSLGRHQPILRARDRPRPLLL
jgi:hypothetical protein